MGAKDISPEVVERAIALLRRYVSDCRTCSVAGYFLTEARAIVALLPEPADPDIAEVREDLALFYEKENESGSAPIPYCADMIAEVRAGKRDHEAPIRFGLIALKRGRQLSQDQPS